MIEGGQVTLYGDGKYVRDWLFVEDHVRAIETVLQKGKVGETYLVGGLTEDINHLEVTENFSRFSEKMKAVLNLLQIEKGMIEDMRLTGLK